MNKQATFEVVNDLKEIITERETEMLRYVFDIHASQEVNNFMKQKIEEWDFAMASTEMDKKHYHLVVTQNIFNEHDLHDANNCP